MEALVTIAAEKAARLETESKEAQADQAIKGSLPCQMESHLLLLRKRRCRRKLFFATILSKRVTQTLNLILCNDTTTIFDTIIMMNVIQRGFGVLGLGYFLGKPVTPKTKPIG